LREDLVDLFLSTSGITWDTAHRYASAILRIWKFGVKKEFSEFLSHRMNGVDWMEKYNCEIRAYISGGNKKWRSALNTLRKYDDSILKPATSDYKDVIF